MRKWIFDNFRRVKIINFLCKRNEYLQILMVDVHCVRVAYYYKIQRSQPTHNECVARVAISPTVSALFSIDHLYCPTETNSSFSLHYFRWWSINYEFLFLKNYNNSKWDSIYQRTNKWEQWHGPFSFHPKILRKRKKNIEMDTTHEKYIHK